MKTIIDTRLLEHYGDLELENYDYRGAADFYESVYQIKKDDINIALKLGHLLFLSADYQDSIKIYLSLFRGFKRREWKKEYKKYLGFALLKEQLMRNPIPDDDEYLEWFLDSHEEELEDILNNGNGKIDLDYPFEEVYYYHQEFTRNAISIAEIFLAENIKNRTTKKTSIKNKNLI